MLLPRLLAHLPVIRDEDRDFVAKRGDLARQRSDYFAKTTGSGPGRAFRGRKNNLHSRSSMTAVDCVGTEC